MKLTLKSKILDFVDTFDGGATYMQIVRFAHDCKYGSEAWLINPDRRGYFSNAFSQQWIYTNPNPFKIKPGYLVKRGVKSGWLEKQSNGCYKTVKSI